MRYSRFLAFATAVLVAGSALALVGPAGAQEVSLRERLRGFAAGWDPESQTPDVVFRQGDGFVAGVRCGTRPVSPQEVEMVDAVLRDYPLPPEAERARRKKTVSVVFHVVTQSDGAFDVSDEAIEEQMRALNKGFRKRNYRFVLRDTRRVVDDEFATQCKDPYEAARFKRENAVDPARILNMYTCKPSGGTLGYATFPWDHAEGSYMHGVVLLHSTLPGGSSAPYNEGATATHEVGHYLGLWHTFQSDLMGSTSGCFGTGDKVGDTAAEDTPAYGCPRQRDTCPGGGRDPITNFMDYTDDACMVKFTRGQGVRLDWVVAGFKPHLIGPR